MNKNLKKLIATALTAATVFSTMAITTSADSVLPPEFRYINTVKVIKPVGIFELTALIGDSNMDGKITQIDATYILRYVLWRDAGSSWFFWIDGKAYTKNSPMYEMDVNQDGKVTQVDATLLLRYILWRDTQ